MIDESVRLYYLIEQELTWRLRGGPLTAMDINRLAREVADEICRQPRARAHPDRPGPRHAVAARR